MGAPPGLLWQGSGGACQTSGLQATRAAWGDSTPATGLLGFGFDWGDGERAAAPPAAAGSLGLGSRCVDDHCETHRGIHRLSRETNSQRDGVALPRFQVRRRGFLKYRWSHLSLLQCPGDGIGGIAFGAARQAWEGPSFRIHPVLTTVPSSFRSNDTLVEHLAHNGLIESERGDERRLAGRQRPQPGATRSGPYRGELGQPIAFLPSCSQ